MSESESERDLNRRCTCVHREVDHEPACQCVRPPDWRPCECEAFEPAYDDGTFRCDICGHDCRDRLGQIAPRCAQEYREERNQ